MSKNSPPTRSLPAPHPAPEGSPPSADPPPPQHLYIALVNIDPQVLSQCTVEEKVTIRSEQNPATVTTLTGIRIGDVKPEDVAKIKKAKRGAITALDTAQVQCTVEVY